MRWLASSRNSMSTTLMGCLLELTLCQAKTHKLKIHPFTLSIGTFPHSSSHSLLASNMLKYISRPSALDSPDSYFRQSLAFSRSHYSTVYTHPAVMDIQMERDFCSNFKCCDMKLTDLHALWDHRGICHQNNDICDLPLPEPRSWPSPAAHTSPALSEFLQPPTPPPQPLQLRKPKTLFTRDPLPLVSSASPDSLSASTSSSPRHPNARSAYTRDKIYTPVSTPSTLRLYQPREPVVPWSTPAPVSFYGYYPTLPPSAASPYSPIPLRPYTQPLAATVLDMGGAAPDAFLPTDSLPLAVPHLVSGSASSPSPPSPPLQEAALRFERARPAADEPPAKRHCGSSSAQRTSVMSPVVATIRQRFFRMSPARKARTPDVHARVADAAVATDAGRSAVEERVEDDSDAAASAPVGLGDAGGGGRETSDIVAPALTCDDAIPEHDPEPAAAELLPEPVSPVARPAVFLGGREKTFICQTPGCIKAYLTQNGLRYHEQKGTCIAADGSAPVPAATTVSPAATTSKPSARTAVRRRPARHSARLAQSSAEKADVAARAPETRGSSLASSAATGSEADGNGSGSDDSD
ncbi:hypothetical protein B0H15DRAFT_448080 [Mycena belliarum]|uniref:C2H2-type domain-containing protein n=1 Tax=Mycena belliarum TaxID=1033014 RepID=A0AAD6U1R4_9AGAR|nr:hypothetical protein B0H15DRAFT_448080 [Mycena belliae]